MVRHYSPGGGLRHKMPMLIRDGGESIMDTAGPCEMTTHLTRVTFPVAVVLLLLAACSHPATDAEMTAVNKAFVDCVWTSTTQLDDGKSDPVSVAYGIEASCGVQSDQAMKILLQGARTAASVVAGREMWEDNELKVVVDAILIYRKSRSQRASPTSPAVTNPAGPGADAELRGDYATALRLWRPLADQGNPDAQLRVGYLYDGGYGVPKDYAEAARWYRKAADQGNSGAQAMLGYMYSDGHGVPKDYTEAARWYRKAADRGVATAQAMLGLLYEDGHGVSQDYAEATRWFLKAADQGRADVRYFLGGNYFLGHGVPKDYVQAYMWWNLAAIGGDNDAAHDRDLAAHGRDLVALSMTPGQIAEAQQRTAAWQKAHAGQ